MPVQASIYGFAVSILMNIIYLILYSASVPFDKLCLIVWSCAIIHADLIAFACVWAFCFVSEKYMRNFGETWLLGPLPFPSPSYLTLNCGPISVQLFMYNPVHKRLQGCKCVKVFQSFLLCWPLTRRIHTQSLSLLLSLCFPFVFHSWLKTWPFSNCQPS